MLVIDLFLGDNEIFQKLYFKCRNNINSGCLQKTNGRILKNHSARSN